VNDRPTPVIVYLSGHLRGATHRLAGERLTIGTEDDAEIQVLPHELPPGAARKLPHGRLATLVLSEDTYELQATPGAEIWVNGERVERARLDSGDVLEIGEGGPVLRFRLYSPGTPAYKTMAEVYSDCRDCARHAGTNPLRRVGSLLAGAPRELATQTSPRVRFNLVLLLAVLAAAITVLTVHNLRLEQRLEADRVRIEGLSELLENAQRGAFSAEDFAVARRGLESRLSETLTRVEALESRLSSRQRVISAAADSVVFLQGSYGFVEPSSGRPLRFAETAAEAPQVTLEGDGPLVEILYTGTAFLAAGDGLLLTNRHVAVPWEFDPAAQLAVARGLAPVMQRFRGFVPRAVEPFDVEFVAASDTADVAVLRCELTNAGVRPLTLNVVAPQVGDEVIVLGYPTGIQALLARVDAALVEQWLAEGPVDFWTLAERLAAGNHIAPLATVGVVGQVSAGAVVYDAETTHGGSGGPVLDLDGRVVAVNTAILPEFGGSNLGVPAAQAASLLP